MRLSVHRTCLGGTRECLNGRKEKRARVCSGNKGRNQERNGGILTSETRGKKGSGARFSKGPVTFLACVSQMCPESRPCVHVTRHQLFAQHRLAKSRRTWLQIGFVKSEVIVEFLLSSRAHRNIRVYKKFSSAH